jgi:hypothetical protein
MPQAPDQGDQKIRKKNCQIFQKLAPKVAKSKKGQKYLRQTTFETLKVAQLAKNRPIWSPCP